LKQESAPIRFGVTFMAGPWAEGTVGLPRIAIALLGRVVKSSAAQSRPEAGAPRRPWNDG
jgi:hypothetical protein